MSLLVLFWSYKTNVLRQYEIVSTLLSVSTAYGLLGRYGNLSSQHTRMAMRWFINVWTACSTGFNWQSCGAASWSCNFFDLIAATSSSNIKLSRYCSTVGVTLHPVVPYNLIHMTLHQQWLCFFSLILHCLYCSYKPVIQRYISS